MTGALWQPLVGPCGARIGGGWVRARECRDLATGAIRPLAALPPEVHAALTAPRPPLLGLDWTRPCVMGVLNVTPDSFSDGGRFLDPGVAVAQALRMLDEGADILDIGGESTRPGAATVADSVEIDRTVPVIAALRAAGVTAPISIDTRKAAVAAAALGAGASMVNDVSALTFDAAMAGIVARAAVPLCLMHAQGPPATMQTAPRYSDVTRDVIGWLRARIDAACAAGIARHRLIADPGIGFGKTASHNLRLLHDLAAFHGLGVPLLLGASRKRFIGVLSGPGPAEAPSGERLPGSLAVALHGVAQGMHILRVHDTLATKQALNLQEAIGRADTTR